jgi:glycosyltransferase involved in cell wall biosynthesis
VCERFAVEEPRAGVPTLVCAASVGDPRKRGELLLAAFARLRERRPDARLELVRTPDPAMSPLRFRLPEGAQWVEAGTTEALARAYARAWASVLAAPDEAFGLVLVESLAAGTPVVAARSGAGPEIVRSDAVGRLFEVDDEDGLAGAMEEALDLGARAETARACRAEAARHDWSVVADRYEELSRSVLDGSTGEARP